MVWSLWIAPISAVLGAGLALAGVAFGLRQRDRTDRRAEWRQRFELAVDQLAATSDAARREIAREVLGSLALSEFVTEEDRHLSDIVLTRLLRGDLPADSEGDPHADMDTPTGQRDNDGDDTAGGAR